MEARIKKTAEIKKFEQIENAKRDQLNKSIIEKKSKMLEKDDITVEERARLEKSLQQNKKVQESIDQFKKERELADKNDKFQKSKPSTPVLS